MVRVSQACTCQAQLHAVKQAHRTETHLHWLIVDLRCSLIILLQLL